MSTESAINEIKKENLSKNNEAKPNTINDGGSPPALTEQLEKEPNLKKKRRSRLSLNGESKNKTKQKEDSTTSRTSPGILSYFQKISPTSEESIDKSFKEGRNSNGTEVNDKDSEEMQVLDPDEVINVKENREPVKNDEEKKQKNGLRKKHKERKSSKGKKKLENRKEIEKVPTDSNTVTLKDTKEQKKVRFSEEVKEFSPERRSKTRVMSTNDLAEKLQIQDHNDDNRAQFIPENEPKKIIKNAFSFMMDNRHKSIGQNSPGREEQHIEDSERKETRKKLSLRKSIFQDWAEARGGKKRKLEEEEIEATIESKLKKRAKRLKRMLTQKDTAEHSDADNHSAVQEVFKRKRNYKRRVVVLDSESESLQEKSAQVVPDHPNTNASQQAELGFFGIFNKKSTTKENSVDHRHLELSLKHTEEDISFTSDDLSLKSQEQKDTGENGELSMNLRESGDFTPRSYKRWQMRLKINLNNLNDGEVKKLVDLDKNSVEEMNEIVISTTSSDSDEPLAGKTYCKMRNSNKSMKSVKLAPIFMKTMPKPKVDLVTMEARKKFLHSGIPEQLKKQRKKQQRVEEIEPQIFPKISHIPVKPTNEDQITGRIKFWSLPVVKLNLKAEELYLPSFSNTALIGFLHSKNSTETKTNSPKIQRVSSLRERLEQIKSENPDYPVYKTYNTLHRKHNKNLVKEPLVQEQHVQESKKPKRGRPKKNKNQAVKKYLATVSMVKQPLHVYNQEIWTDFYRPTTSEEIFGNRNSVNRIKHWLETWLEFSEEINSQKRLMRKRTNSGSSSEFESADMDSRDSLKLPGNTLIIQGPPGSGKTNAVYALCTQLGINLLELNASSKRTGKRLMQELQEATQSHQVRKNQASSMSAFLKKDETKSEDSEKKFCLLLIEDVDVVFEQDESFISALSALLTTSKRPLILTTTDANCLHLRKIFLQHPVIKFTRFSSKVMATWLQVMCLVEGRDVNKSTIVELLACNNGDIRRTLLQLQFMVQGNDEAEFNKNLDASEQSVAEKEDMSNMSWSNEEGGHFSENTAKFEFTAVVPVNLGNFWWNLPHLIDTPQLAVLPSTESVQNETKPTSSRDLRNISEIFEVLAITDVMYEKLNIPCNLEPIHRLHINRIKDSLDLGESLETYSSSLDLAHEMSCTLLDGYINLRTKTYPDNSSSQKLIDYSLEAKSWRMRQYKCKDVFLGIVPASYHLDHSAVSTDYCTILRGIARTEIVRSKATNKRNNRFYSYLRSLGINYQEMIIKSACNAFNYKEPL